MDEVEEVVQIGDKKLHWKAKFGGKEKEWDAEIFEQIPDRRIAWRSIDGALNTGMVNFFHIDGGRTRVFLKLNFEPEDAMENVADVLGVISARVDSNLKRFKEFIESRGVETGGWRGQIQGREVISEGNTPRPGSQAHNTEVRSKRIHSPHQD